VRSDDVVQRAPEPPAEARAAADKQVREIYQSDLGAAHGSTAKSELAQKLLRDSAEVGSRGAERYAMLKLALDLSVEAADERVANESIESLAGTFAVDPFRLRAEALLAIAKRPNSSFNKAELARRFISSANEAVSLGDAELAQSLASAAVAVAKKNKDSDALRLASALVRDVAQLRSGYDQAAEALKTLAGHPADPAANGQLGRFNCFLLGDWRAGLPSLRLSDDATYQSLAERESKTPLPLDETIDLADQWWAIADKQIGIAKRNIRQHAAELYQAALPELAGLTKIRVAKRLAEIGAEPHKTVAKVDPAAGTGPQFPRAALVFQDDFNTSSAPIERGQDSHGLWQRGVKDGRYFMSFDCGAVTWTRHDTRLLPWGGGDFAIEVTGRVLGSPDDVWEITTQGQSEKIELGVALSASGRVTIAPTAVGFQQDGPRLGPFEPANMKRGQEFNRALVVAFHQQAWVYVNGVQICDPFALPEGIFPAKIRIAFKTKKGTAEFDDVRIWSVKQFP